MSMLGAALVKAVRPRLIPRGGILPVARQWGVIVGVSTPTVSLTLGGGNTVIDGISYVAHYSPTVGDIVMVDVVGADLVVTGVLASASGPAVRALTGTIHAWAGRNSAPAGYLMCNAQAVSRTTYAALFAVLCPLEGTFTVTIATPAVVTLVGHTFRVGDAVYLNTSGALPTGLVEGTTYYVSQVSGNDFKLCTTRANAYAGVFIATSGSQSGVHTMNNVPYGIGDGSTTFNVPDLRGAVPAGNDDAAGRLTSTGPVYGNNTGDLGGTQQITLTTAQIPAHHHFIDQGNGAPGTGTHCQPNPAATFPSNETTTDTGGGTAHNNVQPTLVTRFIIAT